MFAGIILSKSCGNLDLIGAITGFMTDRMSTTTFGRLFPSLVCSLYVNDDRQKLDIELCELDEASAQRCPPWLRIKLASYMRSQMNWDRLVQLFFDATITKLGLVPQLRTLDLFWDHWDDDVKRLRVLENLSSLRSLRIKKISAETIELVYGCGSEGTFPHLSDILVRVQSQPS